MYTVTEVVPRFARGARPVPIIYAERLETVRDGFPTVDAARDWAHEYHQLTRVPLQNLRIVGPLYPDERRIDQ